MSDFKGWFSNSVHADKGYAFQEALRDAWQAARADTHPPAKVPEDADMFWDAGYTEMCQPSIADLAEYSGQDLPIGESMIVDVMSAKALPIRKLKIWADETDELQWDWADEPNPPQTEGEL